MKRVLSLTLCLALVLSFAVMFSGCSSKGLEFKSNGDGTCAVSSIGTCEDEEIDIPEKSPEGDTVTAIGEKAFESAKITAVKMPESVTEIGAEAFAYCEKLVTIEFSPALKKIGSRAFQDCTSLAEVTLPDGFEEFGRSAGSNGEEYEGSSTFRGCTALAKINIPAKVKAIYDDTFMETALTEVEIKGNFTYGYVELVFGDEGAAQWFEPVLYLEKPDMDDDDIRPLDNDLKAVLYGEIFGKSVKINGEQLAVPSAQATAGTYGRTDEKNGCKIEGSTISSVWFRDGSYQVSETYNFTYNETKKAYEYSDGYGKCLFAVYGKHFFGSVDGYLVLNETYQGE